MALVYLLFAALHLTTRCISVGVHLLNLLPDRLEAALLVRQGTPSVPAPFTLTASILGTCQAGHLKACRAMGGCRRRVVGNASVPP